MSLVNSGSPCDAEDIYKAGRKGHMLGVSCSEQPKWFYFSIQQLFVAVDDQNLTRFSLFAENFTIVWELWELTCWVVCNGPLQS